MKTISVEISNEFDRKLRVVAAQTDLNRSELIRQVLEEKLAQLEGLVSAEPADALMVGLVEADAVTDIR